MTGGAAVFDTEKGLEKEDNRKLQQDDDGNVIRTGTVWTATAHIVTTVIGSGVLSLPWCVAQLGWIGGPITLLIFAFVTWFTASLLAEVYIYPGPVSGTKNYTYMDVVRGNLGGIRTMICGITQYATIVGITIAFTITASISLLAIQKSNCYHKNGHIASCGASTNLNWYLTLFAVAQIFLSQIPNIHKLSGLSTVAAIMSFSYSIIGVALSVVRIVTGNAGQTSVTGIEIGQHLTEAQKVWNILIAFGNIASAYSFSLILIEIQDTLPSPATKPMKKANVIGVSITSMFYMLCGCFGYAAFGNDAPGNMLTGFGFFEPYWLIDFANACIVVHLLGAYQILSQPFFAAVETWCARKWNNSKFIVAEHTKYKISLFRLVWRTCYVLATLGLAVAMPFFNAVLGLVGSIAYWPLTVYFPIEICISQKKIQRFSAKWVGLEFINLSCFLVAVISACGSIQGIITSF